MKYIFNLFFFLSACQMFGQQNQMVSSNQAEKKNHTLYFHWGYHRAAYTKSNISVKGNGYDFTAYDVIAYDDPEELSKTYYDITKLTIPQFNFRVGYYISNKASISIGWDHLKYKVNHHQYVKINGDYVSNGSTIKYENEEVHLSRNFFHLEHTDGLNYIRINYDHTVPLVSTRNNKLGLEAILGAGFGPVCPWSDAILDGVKYRAFFRPAGAAISLNSSLRFNLGKTFFIQSTGRLGAVKLIDDYITKEIRAKQQFGYAEFNVTAGFKFGLPRKN